MGYFAILSAIPGFFISSWILMLLWGGPIAGYFGIPTISYTTSLLVNITLWLAVAPLAAAGRKWH